MARGRIISNAITGDKKVNDLSDDTSRLAFTWLITFADVDGRTNGDPALLRSILFPRRRDITIEQMEGYIREWQRAGLIIWYEANGDWYIAFPNFAKHQPWLRKDREADSIIPPPPTEQANSDNSPAEIPQKTPDNSPKMEAELRQNDGVPPSEGRHDSGLKEIKREEIKLKREEKRSPAAATPSSFSVDRIDPVLILSKASNLPTFPPDQLGWIEVVIRLAENFGVEKTVEAMTRACNRWVSTTGKNKRNYRRTNLAWINLAQDELAGGGEARKKPSEMSDREYLEYISHLAEAQNA